MLLVLPALARAGDRPVILIDRPRESAFRAAVQRFAGKLPGGAGLADSLRRQILDALAFSGLFAAVPDAAFLGPVQSPPLESGAPDCPSWRQIDADALVQGELEGTAGRVRVEFRVLDVARGCTQLLHKRYEGAAGELRRVGKAIADDVVGAFTGQPGVADTEIAFISDRGGSREVYVMEADGQNLRAATHNGSINAFPDWSPDGSSIVYTSYRYRSRPWLFLLTRGRHSPGRILRKLAGVSALFRGVYDPSGDQLAVVGSVDGQTEIFRVAPSGRSLRRLTRNRFIDVSPSFSPDGRRIAFTSDRVGAPQIYVMQADGSDPYRISFDGGYNTSPAWSPGGRWIAYEARVNGQFDIWLIDPEGEPNLPLVTHPRSDEHPTWSPDGRMLAFSSTRRGTSDIYVLDLATRHVRRITDGGENSSPAWGPYRR